MWHSSQEHSHRTNRIESDSAFNVNRSEFLRSKDVGSPSMACHSHDKVLLGLSNLCRPWPAFVP